MEQTMDETILVIDDESYIRDSMAGYLEDFGFRVVQAENGRQGMEQIHAHAPDLILCDLRMPEVDGLEVLARVTRELPQTPIIIVSGAGNIGDTVQALRLGAWDYIIKPIQEMDVLYYAVNKALERKRFLADQERHQRELEEANGRLQRSLERLEQAKDKLIESEKMAALGELVTGVAHEINTPVGIGVTAASLLETRTRELREEYDHGRLKRSELDGYLNTVAEVSQSILVNMEKAAELISNFKQVAADQSSEQLRRFNVLGYINGVLISLAPRYKLSGHSIDVDCPETLEVTSYPGALSRILSNLILNSLIHGFDGRDQGEIQLRVRPREKGLCLVYTDNGWGLDREQQEKIFHPFYTTRRGKGGTGLGMSIVFNLVTQTLKGTIHLDSEPGNGVRITLSLPGLEDEQGE
ncbi:MAG: response regulator [Desulfobacterales bacterium]|nr:response regulator [Desulfobacterales bacterium]